MNKSKRNGGKKIPFDSVIKNYRIKQPKQAFERIRYWDDGRKYDLLRCLTTLAYVSWNKNTFFIRSRAVQTQVILFWKSMSERVGPGISKVQRL